VVVISRYLLCVYFIVSLLCLVSCSIKRFYDLLFSASRTSCFVTAVAFMFFILKSWKFNCDFWYHLYGITFIANNISLQSNTWNDEGTCKWHGSSKCKPYFCNTLFCFSCVPCLLCLLCLNCLIPCTCPQQLCHVLVTGWGSGAERQAGRKMNNKKSTL